jgi:hypothetical protein
VSDVSPEAMMTGLALLVCAYYWGWFFGSRSRCPRCAAVKELVGAVPPARPVSAHWVTPEAEEECDCLGHHIPPGRENCRCGVRWRTEP